MGGWLAGWLGGWLGGWGVGIPSVEFLNIKRRSRAFSKIVVPYSRFARIDETNLDGFRHSFSFTSDVHGAVSTEQKLLTVVAVYFLTQFE